MTIGPERRPAAPWSLTALLWAVFAGVHAWLWLSVLSAPHTPLNDVTGVYYSWVDEGVHGLGWVGIDQVWVYPSAALLPILLAAVAGLAHYGTTWLAMIVVLDAVALAFLTRGGTSRRDLGYWWLAFLALLGPIAIGRLDSVSVPLAIVGLLFAVRRPAVAGILLGLATWIKVWPAALVLAVIVATRRRITVLAAVVGVSVAVVLVVVLLGGSLAVVTGFVGQQTGRGLQLEAPVTVGWLWLEVAHAPGVSTAFDPVLLTFQTSGPGTQFASMLMTPIMVVVMLGIVLLGVRATRRGATATTLLAPLALALTTAFIVTNKVGSPQYQTWIAAPIVIGLLLAPRGGGSFRVPAVVALVIAAMTQIVYPWAYDSLVLAQPSLVALVTARDLLLVGLLVWAVVRLWRSESVVAVSLTQELSPIAGASAV